MTRLLLAPFLLLTLLTATPALAHDHPMPVAAKANTPTAVTFRNDMRRVWEDHIVWTRNVILSFAHELPDKSVVVGRLLKNQDDIAALFRPYYGAQNATELAALLREHITIAAEILTAAKAGDTAGVGAAVARWQANADQISAFLAQINPRQWPFAAMKPMMREHRFADDVTAYESVHTAILAMADMLSLGIIAQQPRGF